MARGEEKAKRWRIWRPRFTVRTLAIVVTLVCAYFGAWEATKRFGVPDMTAIQIPASGKYVTKEVLASASSPAPLLIVCEKCNIGLTMSGQPGERINPNFTPGKYSRRCYYLWIFGPTIKLPIETALTNY